MKNPIIKSMLIIIFGFLFSSQTSISAERNQQGDAAERSEMQLRILKNRHTGSTGPIDKLLYDENTGRLSIPMSTYFGA